jgi:hypothetical protein
MSAALMSSGGMDRAFSPHRIHLALNLGRWPRLVWQWAFGPQIRKVLQSTASPFFRANGASLYQPGATPQEWNRRTKQRAEGPIQRIGGYEVGHQFRGVTKMIPQQIPAAGFYQRSSSQGILDYSTRRRSRVTEDSSATANSAAHGVFIPRSRGNRQGILDGSNRTSAEGNCRGILGSSDAGMERGAALRRVGIGRAFSPQSMRVPRSWGVAPGWYSFGPLALQNLQAPQGADVPVSHASPPSSAPTAHLYTSLGQRPRTCPRIPHEG